MLAQTETGLHFLMQKIKSNINKALIYYFESFFHIDSQIDSRSLKNDDKNLPAILSELFSANNDISIKILHFNAQPSIVPFKYFDKNLMDKYLETNTKISGKLINDLSKDKKINIVYSIDEFLTRLFNKVEIKVTHNNYFTLIYNKLFNRVSRSKGLCFFINLNCSSFDVIIFNNNEFIFFNKFKINDEDEFLYYLLFVINNFEGSNNNEKIIFLGRFEKFNHYYELASKYSQIEFIEDSEYSILDYNSQSFSIINENNFRK